MTSLSPAAVLVVVTLFALLMASSVILLMVVQAQRQTKARLAALDLRTAHERQLLEARVEVEERERQRIAREVHDKIGPMLSLLKYEMHRLKRNHPRLDDLVDMTINDARQISHHMYPMLLERLGLVALLRELADYYTSENLRVDTELPPRVLLSPSAQIAVYRISSELLSNLVKHAQADHALIRLNTHPGRVSYLYRDNGIGFDPTSITPGIGLDSIRVRVQQLGSELQLVTQPGQGLQVAFDLHTAA